MCNKLVLWPTAITVPAGLQSNLVSVSGQYLLTWPCSYRSISYLLTCYWTTIRLASSNSHSTNSCNKKWVWYQCWSGQSLDQPECLLRPWASSPATSCLLVNASYWHYLIHADLSHPGESLFTWHNGNLPFREDDLRTRKPLNLAGEDSTAVF